MGRVHKTVVGVGAILLTLSLYFPVAHAAQKQPIKTRKAVSTGSPSRQSLPQKPQPLNFGENAKKDSASDPFYKDCGCAAQWGGVLNATRYPGDH